KNAGAGAFLLFLFFGRQRKERRIWHLFCAHQYQRGSACAEDRLNEIKKKLKSESKNALVFGWERFFRYGL
ncbi:MAG: hypothetical protein WC372_05950, partial [Candidatus Neomarinimicrobiota bacterium]